MFNCKNNSNNNSIKYNIEKNKTHFPQGNHENFNINQHKHIYLG